jgi:hypothetical protein
MAFFKKPTTNSSVKGQLKNLFRDVTLEIGKELKETGKEMVKGVTMLPKELLEGLFSPNGASTSSSDKKDKSWEEEWLKNNKDNKDKPPLSDKEGGHSKIDPNKPFEKEGKAQEEAIRRRLASTLNSQYTRTSSQSTYGQQKQKEEQEKRTPVYDKLQKEKKDRDDQQKQQAAQRGNNNLPAQSFKRKTGDWKHGTKRKKSRDQSMGNNEFATSKGK